MTIEISNETSEIVDLKRVEQLAAFALSELKLHPATDLGIVFVDEGHMEELHIKWMDEPGPTDVLSFPMDELRPGSEESPSSEGVLGDIVVCPQVAKRQAETAGHSTMNEILLLVTHGVLHLVGFDHAEPDEEAEMFGLQKQILTDYYSQEENNA